MPCEQRLRDYLTRDEVSALLRAAKRSRHGARNHAMILIAYRHGLRASEVINLRLSDVDLKAGTIYCRRAKGSRSSLHPLKQDEVTLLVRSKNSTTKRTFGHFSTTMQSKMPTR